MAFRDQHTLSKMDDFRGRVLVAMVLTAINVQGEPREAPTPTAQQQRRSVYAQELLNDPERYLTRVLYGVVADATITQDATDQILENRVSAIWDGLAGVV